MSEDRISLSDVATMANDGQPKARISLEDVGRMADDGHTTAPGIAASIGRGLAPYAAGAAVGAAAGAPFAGVGAVPGAIAGAGAVGLTQLATGLYGPIAKALGLPGVATPQEASDTALDVLGVRRPQTATERTVEATTGGIVGAATGAGAAGEVSGALTGAPKAIAERLAERPGLQAVSGATGGAAAQTAAEHGAGPVGQMLAGMAGGAVPGVLPAATSAVVAPRVSPKVQALLDAGVELTPGQLAGGIPKRGEEAAKSIPITGSAIRNAEWRSIDTFNVGTVNRALEPLGVQVPPNKTGRDLIAFGQKALDDAYDQVLPNLSFQLDKGFQQQVTQLRSMVDTLPDQEKRQFDTQMGRLAVRLAPTGTMNGDTLKLVQSELTKFASDYKASSVAGQRQLGHAIDALNDHIRDAVQRQNPQYADRLQSIDTAYAMFVRVEKAASNRARNDGRFTGGDLLTAIKQEDPTVRKRGFARGDALLQDWAQTAHDVMGNKMPDSGTPERMLWNLGGAGALLTNPAATVATILGTSAPYTSFGGDWVRSYAQPGPRTRAVGDFIRLPVTPLPIMLNPGAGAAQSAASGLGVEQ